MERFEFMDGTYYEFELSDIVKIIFTDYDALDHVTHQNLYTDQPDVWSYGYGNTAAAKRDVCYINCIACEKARAAYKAVCSKESPYDLRLDKKKAIREKQKLVGIPGEINKQIVGVVVTGKGWMHRSIFPEYTILPESLADPEGTLRLFVDLDNWQGKLINYKPK